MKFNFLPIVILILYIQASLCSAEVLFDFDGQFNSTREQLNVKLQFPPVAMGAKNTRAENSLILKGMRMSDDTFHVSLNVEHLQTPLFDLSSEIESLLTIPRGISINDYISGKIWSQYSLVDFKPVREMSGEFRIQNNRLYLNQFLVSDMVCNGFIDLQAPYKMDLSFKLNDITMNDFLRIWTKNKDIPSGGYVTGEIKAAGSFEDLHLKGDLASHNGFVKKLEFDTMHLKIEGVYPHMEILDSTVTRPDGLSYTIAGFVNLNDTENFIRQIKSLKFAPVVSETASQREWTIRRLKLDETTTTEFKYLMHKEDGLGFLPEESDMLGIERSVEF